MVHVDSEAPSAEKTELNRALKVIAEVSRLYSSRSANFETRSQAGSGRRSSWALARLRVQISQLISSVPFVTFERTRLVELTRSSYRGVCCAAETSKLPARLPSARAFLKGELGLGEEKRLLQRMRRGEAIAEQAKRK